MKWFLNNNKKKEFYNTLGYAHFVSKDFNTLIWYK